MPDIHFPVSQFAAMDDRTTQEMGCISLPNQKEGGEFFQTPTEPVFDHSQLMVHGVDKGGQLKGSVNCHQKHPKYYTPV